MIQFLLSALLLLEIHGVVVDPTGRPVPDAKISCNATAASTNDEGKFTFPDVQSCMVTIQKNGFSTQTRTVESDKEQSFTLELAPMSESVLVTAGAGSPVALEEAGVAGEIFTQTNLEARQFAPVGEVLRDVAGLSVVQTGSGGGQMNIFTRGGDSNATLVLMDGVPLTDPGGNIDFVNLTSQGLQRLEVVRGPESALFGAEAASGVIQLFSKQGDPEATYPHGMLTYERGSFSTDHWAAGIDGGFLKRFDYALTTDQYRTTGEFPNNPFRNTTGTANIGYHFSDATTLRAIFREWDSFTGLPGQTYYNLYNYNAFAQVRDSALTLRLDDARGPRFNQRAYFAYHRNRNYSADTTTDSETASALVNTVVGPGGAPYTYLLGLVPNSTTIAPPGMTLVSASTYPYPYNSLSLTDRTSGNYQGTLVHPGGSFTFGYDVERQAGIISGTNVSRLNNGVTLFDQYSFGKRVFFSVGARIENSSVFGEKFAPRAAVTFRLPTETYFRLSVSHGIQEPSLLQNYAYEPASGYVGNLQLKPERTDSFEAGLDREWFNRRVRTGVSYFRNLYRDLIQYTFATYPGTWDNVSQAWARGVELSGSAKLLSSVTLHANYTKLFTRDLSTGLELLRRPRNSGATYVEYTRHRLSLMAGARFVGERQDNDYFFGVNRIQAYDYVYFNASWQATKHVAPFLRINNLTNEYYQEALGYAAWSRNASGGIRVSW